MNKGRGGELAWTVEPSQHQTPSTAHRGCLPLSCYKTFNNKKHNTFLGGGERCTKRKWEDSTSIRESKRERRELAWP